MKLSHLLFSFPQNEAAGAQRVEDDDRFRHGGSFVVDKKNGDGFLATLVTPMLSVPRFFRPQPREVLEDGVCRRR